ncbi:MAG: CocE/NonD family hydrolase [Chthoniobacterales bacterium]
MPYQESPEAAIAERKKMMDSVLALLETRREEATKSRNNFFRPDTTSPEAYEASLAPYRAKLIEQIGWPLTEPRKDSPQGRSELIAEDEHGRIYRVHVAAYGPVESYGLLFLPRDKGNYPLIIAQHGGWGTPEIASGIHKDESGNHKQMISGLRSHEVAIFAPQLFVWHNAQEPHLDKGMLDRQFQHLGGSRAAMDMLMLTRALDWLCTQEEIDANRVGMTGLSYGGFYTLYFTAIEPRIRVAASSCWVNDRYRNSQEDWAWRGTANYFLDGEVGRMICPRPLFVEVGEKDHIFTPEAFPGIAAEMEVPYRELGLSDRFEARIHPEGHDYDPDAKARAFLLKYLSVNEL